MPKHPRAVREHADFGRRSADECELAGDQQGADLWRRHTERWLGKLADLIAA